jgi:cytochrome c biogenesis protein CcmG/thiol:disulfide interchange protein DsbE
VPETFVVAADGTIVDKHVGPLSPESVRARLMPAIEKALAMPAPGS